jgi:methyl-accepting chemotaxis protein
MDEQETRKATPTSRLSLESAAGACVGALLSGAIALGLVGLTESRLTAGLGVLGVSLALMYWTYGRARKNLGLVDAIESTIDEISAGHKLARIDEASFGSSYAAIAHGFNAVFDVLSDVSHRVLAEIEQVQSLPERITVAMGQIEVSAEDQEAAVEETASLIANINSSMKDINERIEKLQRAADESASSILQMGSAVDEVARNTGTLHEGVESTTSSVHEMGASIRQVAESAEQVQRIAEGTASSMTEMDRSVQEVNGHAREAAEMTEKVTAGADSGSRAVAETIADIELIRQRTSEARGVLDRLVARIGEIGGILGSIGEINDETNLLSLNAAIIAAQAGEQGKAFLVVANHVKTLAKRTASSTKDIESLIDDVQRESADAVTAMNSGMDAIETGVQRSQTAGHALGVIQESARTAYQRVEGIAKATGEQSRSSALVAKAAQDTSSQVQQISAAMLEQSKVSEEMLKRAESALDACRHVHRSTDEQRETGRYISESISSITDMIRHIRENANNHAVASDSVSEAVFRLLDNAQKSGKQVPEINQMLSELRSGAAQVVEELSRFELASPDPFEDPS